MLIEAVKIVTIFNLYGDMLNTFASFKNLSVLEACEDYAKENNLRVEELFCEIKVLQLK